VDYLRISVTDRCNLRCRYCTPSGEFQFRGKADILSYEEIADVAREAAKCGFTKLRITGGEPLVRRDVEVLVGMLANIEGIRDLAMTTNGILLAQRAQELADAGLQRVNVSLDAVRPERYAYITGGGDVREVLRGIDAARRAGLSPTKLNCVVRDSPLEPDAREVAAYGRRNGMQVRFIREMNLAAGRFSVVEGGSGGDCARCTRLRLSSDGLVRPCLFSDLQFSVRQLGPREALRRAVESKPRAGRRSMLNSMRAIGG
jgi:cyclic pyranopterin phosphate synthase